MNRPVDEWTRTLRRAARRIKKLTKNDANPWLHRCEITSRRLKHRFKTEYATAPIDRTNKPTTWEAALSRNQERISAEVRRTTWDVWYRKCRQFSINARKRYKWANS